MQIPLVPFAAAFPVEATGCRQGVPSITVLLRVAKKFMPAALQFNTHSSFAGTKRNALYIFYILKKRLVNLT